MRADRQTYSDAVHKTSHCMHSAITCGPFGRVMRSFPFVCLSVLSVSLIAAKDVLPNIHHTQAAPKWPPPGSDGMIPSAAAGRYLQRAHYHTSCNRTGHSVDAGGDGSAQRFFVPGDLDLWPLTKHFRVPCEFDANPFSASPDIWFTYKKTKSHRQR